MRCPSCGHEESKVVDSRPTDDFTSIRRRRKCIACGYRFTTYERLGENPLIVVKTDGSSEAYDREKLFRGLLLACAKRPVTSDEISALVDDIELEMRNNMLTEIKSKDLGKLAMRKLAGLDEVAYIRFASVYNDFQNVEEFASLLEELRA